MASLNRIYGKCKEMEKILESDDPDVLTFRKTWDKLEDAGVADGYGGMECRRRYLEWVEAGKPKKNGQAELI